MGFYYKGTLLGGKVVSGCFIVTSSCPGIENQTRATLLLPALWSLVWVWLQWAGMSRGPRSEVRIQRLTSLQLWSRHLTSRNGGGWTSWISVAWLWVPSLGCIPEVRPLGLNPPRWFSPMSITSFPENISSQALESLGGIETLPAACESPLRSIPEQLRFPGEVVQGPHGARGHTMTATALSQPKGSYLFTSQSSFSPPQNLQTQHLVTQTWPFLMCLPQNMR